MNECGDFPRLCRDPFGIITHCGADTILSKDRANGRVTHSMSRTLSTYEYIPSWRDELIARDYLCRRSTSALFP